MTAGVHPDRCFSPDPATRRVARVLYAQAASLPLVCPHGHVEARLFADEAARFGSPVDLLITRDHYVTRMLYSQGIPLEKLGVPIMSGGNSEAPLELDHRIIWRTFCENYHLFRGTPSGMWLTQELADVFGIQERPTLANADSLYDRMADCLTRPDFRPRALFERFGIEVLCTTDAAWDDLQYHQLIRQSDWSGRILPTFRPDGVINLETPGWRSNLDRLMAVSGVNIVDYRTFLRALEDRRAFFKSLGATATDHAALTPATGEMSDLEVEGVFQRALRGELQPGDPARFTAHVLMEMARMSIEDGLVMQLHPGSLRNHNQLIFQRYGADRGADIPIATEFTRNLLPLLNQYGNDPRLTLIVFTLDESTYGRELAPLAGHYPAMKLGPPWWFFDSLNGMARYFDQVMETAGIYNTVGFNDDTRAFCSIPARHDLWRRAAANWLAGLVARHLIDLHDAEEMMTELAVGLARRSYRL